MGDTTGIAWTDRTLNLWIGCAKISQGCANCYAIPLSQRMGLDVWGPKANRKETKGPWQHVHKWQREAAAGKEGVMGPGLPILVFTGSMMDFFEQRDDLKILRGRAFQLFKLCPHLHFQVLTKRAQYIAECLPSDWGYGYPNVWLGVSIENKDFAWRADALRSIPATVRFISYEPALGPLAGHVDLCGIDWLIYGGESGPGYRKEDKQWARDIEMQCGDYGTAFFHKQSAAYRTEMGIKLDGRIVRAFPKPRSIAA